MCVGDFRNSGLDPGSGAVLIEADLEQGVIAVPAGKYASHNTCICRPVELNAEECRRVCDYMTERIGLGRREVVGQLGVAGSVTTVADCCCGKWSSASIS